MIEPIDTTHLTPTLACSDVAELKKCSVRLIRKEVATVPGAYLNGSGWQIPREAINRPPLSEVPRKRGRKKAEPQ